MNYYYADENSQAIGPITEDQLRALVRNGSITPDTQVLQEGTTEWCQYGLIAPPPNPPAMTTTQPLIGAPVGKPNAKSTFPVVVVAVLAAAILLGSVYYYAKVAKPTPKQDVKVGAAVDAITGFATFLLGSPSSDFMSRVKSNYPYGGATVVELMGNEKEWAGFAVREVRLHFEEGVTSKIDVKLAPDGSEFAEAFKLRYGRPASEIPDFAQWEGNNTKVQIFSGYRDRVHIEITSKKVNRFIEEQTSARAGKEKDATEQRAREAAKKF